ncbi:tRNA synthetases class I (M)-domain-containing protein [Abortiporus biennis]|nr:tRNA synthetases class I (M)-domain-containing protein [Abortiporus biennis]
MWVLRQSSKSLRTGRLVSHRHFHLTPRCLNDAVKPYYVTTPIFYPNSVPHIGHLYTVVVGDIFARHAKLVNRERPVYFVNGTDEHGLKIQKAAKDKGLEPLVFCDQLNVFFRDLVEKANANVTTFARTSEAKHYDSVQHLWKKMEEKGLIYKGKHEGWYSISDECFYTSAQVTEVKTDSDTIYIATETGNRVEWSEEENYKFRLSAFTEPLLAHYKAHPDSIYPPQHYMDIVSTLASGPLDDLSVSRPKSRLSWGIPVPGDDDHTIYVWIDALTTYLSASGYPWSTEQALFDNGWPPNLQVIGKDILRFHAIYFPAMLMALDLPLPQQLLSHSHWTVNQRKMSKSIGNVVNPIQAIDEFGVDVVRYYLARVGGRFKDDIDWSQSQVEKHSREIMSTLGNLYSRISSKKIQDRVAPSEVNEDLYEKHKATILAPLLAHLETLKSRYASNMENLQVADVLDDIMATLQEANVLMTQTAPWSSSTEATVVTSVTVTIIESLRICGILLQPFIPGKAEQLLNGLSIPTNERSLTYAEVGKGPKIPTIQGGIRLFEKLKGSQETPLRKGNK